MHNMLNLKADGLRQQKLVSAQYRKQRLQFSAESPNRRYEKQWMIFLNATAYPSIATDHLLMTPFSRIRWIVTILSNSLQSHRSQSTFKMCWNRRFPS